MCGVIFSCHNLRWRLKHRYVQRSGIPLTILWCTRQPLIAIWPECYWETLHETLNISSSRLISPLNLKLSDLLPTLGSTALGVTVSIKIISIPWVLVLTSSVMRRHQLKEAPLANPSSCRKHQCGTLISQTLGWFWICCPCFLILQLWRRETGVSFPVSSRIVLLLGSRIYQALFKFLSLHHCFEYCILITDVCFPFSRSACGTSQEATACHPGLPLPS